MMKEPDFKVLPAATPARIGELLRRCLVKDPRNRLQAIAEARIAIQETLAGSETVVSSAAASQQAHRRWVFAVALGVIIGAVIATAMLQYFREAPAAAREIRLEITTPATQSPLEFAPSPDGRYLVFVASGDGPARLWLRALDKTDAQPMSGTDGAAYPFWSPDSRSIGFFATGKLKRIDIDGGSPQVLADAALGLGGTWNQSGVILFAPSGNGPVRRILATGGNAQDATRLEQGQTAHVWPRFLPDGHHFVFVSNRGEIYLGSLDVSNVKRIMTADAGVGWIEPGLLAYIQQGTLRAQSLDIASGTVRGNPVTVADRVGYNGSVYFGGFSASGGIVAYRGGTDSRTQLTWFDRTGKMLNTVGNSEENNVAPELSPDNRRVVVDRNVQGNTDVWLIDLLRGGSTRFTFDQAVDRRPLWSADGTQIVFTSNRKNAFDLYKKPSTGAGVEQLLLESPNSTKTPDGWSADGRFLLYNENNGKTSDILALPMQGDRKPIPIANSPFSENNGQFSPDGRWVAYQSNESGRFEIYVVPFPPGGGKWQVSTSGGIWPRWSHNGKELSFISPNSEMMASSISASGSSLEASPPVRLFQTRISGTVNVAAKQEYDVSADGRFLINSIAADLVNAPITVILNWYPPKP
jgi:Tol biopolymer transport system component